MNHGDRLEHILYISLPEEMYARTGNLLPDPSVLLPVEIPRGMEDDWTMADISWEMIVSAMLKILAWNPRHENASIFRNFILTVKPDVVAELTAAAIVKAGKLDFDAAEEIFRALSEIDPAEQKTILNLAYLYEQKIDLYSSQESREQVDEAVRQAHICYLKALERHPRSPDVLFGAGYFFLMTGRTEMAALQLRAFMEYSDKSDARREKVRRVLEELEQRNNLDSLFTEAFEAIKDGRESEGIETIRRFLEESPGTWSGWFLLGWACRRTGDYAEAAAALETALELEDREVDIYNELAICLMELEQYERCRSMLEKASSIEPFNVKILSNRAILALKSGNESEAFRLFSEVLEIDPEDPVARRYRNLLSEH